jgi:hypothetical protein
LDSAKLMSYARNVAGHFREFFWQRDETSGKYLAEFAEAGATTVHTLTHSHPAFACARTTHDRSWLTTHDGWLSGGCWWWWALVMGMHMQARPRSSTLIKSWSRPMPQVRVVFAV